MMEQQMSTTKFDPGVSSTALNTIEVAYGEITEPIKIAINRALCARRNDDALEYELAEIIKAMRETHQSICALCLAAEKWENDKSEKTGRWMDAVLLARPQYDATFVALLLALDYAEWGIAFKKAGWAANAIRWYYSRRRFRCESTIQELHMENIRRLKQHAKTLGVSPREWCATTTQVRKQRLHCKATQRDAIKPLPTPGVIIEKRILENSSFERLGELLWQQWKLLCDPAHIGIGLLITKAYLRDGPENQHQRQEFIRREIPNRSIYPSLVAIMTVVTLLALLHKDNPELLASVVRGWKWLETGTIEGNIIWYEWAAQALGVLPA